MSKQTYPQINGAVPALDRKKVGNPYVMSGKNYVVDLDGPRSAFGFQRGKEKFTPSLFMQSFEIGNTIYYFAHDNNETFTQVSGYDWQNRQVIPVNKFISTDLLRPKLQMPWTHAFVGTFHYFANRTFGVLQYDAINNIWKDVTTTIGIANIFFVTESGGRLVTLSEGITSWSAIDNGMDNTPSVATGAGFQSISLVGTLEQNSDYLGIQKTARGYLSFTTKGVLRSELIDSINPFRHTPGDSKHKPLNPWCVTKISDTEIVILSRNGLFISDSGLFKEWQPLMGEYLKRAEIPPLHRLANGFISIYYSIARDEFFVSLAQSEIISQFTKAWVLYLKRDQWGSFNRNHTGFVFLEVDNTGTDFKQAFIDTEGRMNCLDDSAISLAIAAANTRGDYYQVLLQYTPFTLETTTVFSTNVRLSGFSKSGLPDIAAYYEVNGNGICAKTEIQPSTKTVANQIFPTVIAVNSEMCQIGIAAQGIEQLANDSSIEVGLFRFTDEQANDQLSLITNVAISCLAPSDSFADEFDDWLADYPSDISEDWLAIVPDVLEDWGDEIASGSVYTQNIKGTLDGYDVFEDQFVPIDEVQIAGKTKFCSSKSAGLFQAIELNATAVGESFYLKTLEINGNLIGRI